MAVRTVPSGTRGFDCNFPLTTAQSNAAVRHGFRFVARYVPRVAQADIDLTVAEVRRILSAGLAVTPVQHVEKVGWMPTPEKGRSYGIRAAQSAISCGIDYGTNVWLDLEGVSQKADPEDLISYANAWFDEVQRVGYLPGTYVGWRAGLTSTQLYRRLKFTRYWSAYNLDGDLFPAVVDVCMRQGEPRTIDYPRGWNATDFPIDTNIVIGDLQDRFPMVMAPDDWNVWR